MTNTRTEYLLLAADDSNESCLVCYDICDTLEEAESERKSFLDDDTEDKIEYIHIYKAERVSTEYKE